MTIKVEINMVVLLYWSFEPVKMVLYVFAEVLHKACKYAYGFEIVLLPAAIIEMSRFMFQQHHRTALYYVQLRTSKLNLLNISIANVRRFELLL